MIWLPGFLQSFIFLCGEKQVKETEIPLTHNSMWYLVDVFHNPNYSVWSFDAWLRSGKHHSISMQYTVYDEHLKLSLIFKPGKPMRMRKMIIMLTHHEPLIGVNKNNKPKKLKHRISFSLKNYSREDISHAHVAASISKRKT